MSDLVARYRARALGLVPEAEEGASYGMPALRYRGRPLVALMENRSGYGLYPFSPAVVESVAAAAGLRTTKGSVQFTADTPVPDELFDAMVLARRDEIDAALSRGRPRTS